MDDGGLKRVNKPGGGGDEEEENEFKSFLDQKPNAGQILADIQKTLADTEKENNERMKAERRKEDQFGFCCGVEW